MNVLEEHPAPWTKVGNAILDGRHDGGGSYCLAHLVAKIPDGTDEGVLRLITLAPDILGALIDSTELTDHFGPPEWKDFVHGLISDALGIPI